MELAGASIGLSIVSTRYAEPNEEVSIAAAVWRQNRKSPVAHHPAPAAVAAVAAAATPGIASTSDWERGASGKGRGGDSKRSREGATPYSTGLRHDGASYGRVQHRKVECSMPECVPRHSCTPLMSTKL